MPAVVSTVTESPQAYLITDRKLFFYILKYKAGILLRDISQELMIMKKFGLLLGLLVLPMPSTGASQRLAVDAPTVMLAPGHLLARALVEPDPANGSIQMTADSSEFYRRSEIQLNGDAAPRSTTFEYLDLPRGRYEIHVVLLDAHGEPRATVNRRLDVVPRN